MIPQTYARALLEVAPSRILASLIDGKDVLPPEWRRLSSYPIRGKPDKFVLKHPISAREMELKNLNGFWSSANDEEKKRFLDALRKAEETVAGELEKAGSIREFARLWDKLPAELREKYENVLKENGFSPAIAEELVNFPADPMLPDHDWLSRLDVYASLRAGKVKLLRFKLSPIQGFIANARPERDLWAGSHILSLLTYLAISKIWNNYGPHSVIFPHLRGQPFFEHELSELTDKRKLLISNIPNKVLAVVPADADLEALEKEIREGIASFLEHLFEAAWEFYGMGAYFEWSGDYENTLRRYFSITLEGIPLEKLKPENVISENLAEYLKGIPDGEESEIHSYSELFLLLDQLTEFKSREHVRPEQKAGFKCTLCGEHLAIGGDADYTTVKERWKKFVDALHKGGIYDIKAGERLCPLCLVKRFYRRFYPLWENNFEVVTLTGEEIGRIGRNIFTARALRGMTFSSVSEVAMRRPTREAIEKYENGELYVEENGERRPVTWADVYGWVLHKLGIENSKSLKFGGSRAADLTPLLNSLSGSLRPLFKELAPNSEVFYVENLRDIKALAKIYGTDENDPSLAGVDLDSIRNAVNGLAKLIGEPPKYYAILKMDGDNMGKIISGDRAVKTLREYALGDAPNLSRPVTPPIHIAITRSLSRFAVDKVPAESERKKAELLYAGGDDVFALIPTDKSVGLAYNLQEHFRTDWDGFEPLQGRTTSMSAGLLVVYYKEPLYSAVRRVNELEHLAKESGKNALAIGYLKHSGSYYRIAVNWRLFEGQESSPLQSLLRELQEDEKGLSNKVIYEIADGVDTWPNDPDAVLNLLKYELSRHSNYKEKKDEQVFRRLAEFLWVARHVRVRVSGEDLRKLGLKDDRETATKINKAIEEIIVDDPVRGEPDERFGDLERELANFMNGGNGEGLWFKRLTAGLSSVVGENKASEIAGLVLRKQLRDAAHLLKVLLEMGVGA
ncbi:type III-B CRISPR-associated protein Cas10/Cmr2 [Thermococcus zilligii]|uniref:type III-B CRISPR-associated protein Cas10/Cmr2 n=1 Tax=Thermococcus zilligii TaxID=54076 RepID=UPI00029B271A|nr:type III-B CRISPR-associated protein Cas10/Cmr2 [Thermococcus zilligii]